MSKFISKNIPDNSATNINKAAEFLNKKPAKQGSNQQGVQIKHPSPKK